MNSKLDYVIELIKFNFQGPKQNFPNVLPSDHPHWNQTHQVLNSSLNRVSLHISNQ